MVIAYPAEVPSRVQERLLLEAGDNVSVLQHSEHGRRRRESDCQSTVQLRYRQNNHSHTHHDSAWRCANPAGRTGLPDILCLDTWHTGTAVVCAAMSVSTHQKKREYAGYNAVICKRWQLFLQQEMLCAAAHRNVRQTKERTQCTGHLVLMNAAARYYLLHAMY
jgi:hypothetical protein